MNETFNIDEWQWEITNHDGDVREDNVRILCVGI